MNRLSRTFAVTLSAAFLGGCITPMENPPLVFGKSLAVGIGISGSAPEQSASMTVGVESKNIAVVPVTTRQSDNAHTQITASAGNGHQDALSVLGQFNVNAKSGPNLALGEFFATGLAAKKLSDGFACQIAGNPNCNPNQPSP